MPDYQLRTAAPEDAEAVEKVLKASYPALMASAYDQAVLAPVLEPMTKANISLLESGNYYVAETVKGLVVGCGGWSVEKPPGTDYAGSGAGHLRHFGTDPDWIRRGIGREIYKQCESDARFAGIRELEVCSSLNAEQFYDSLGFKKIKIISVVIGANHFPSVLMRRTI